MMSKVLKILLPLLVLAAGVWFAMRLSASKPAARKATIAEATVLVEVLRVQPSREVIQLRAEGVVLPDRVVSLTPLVAGAVLRLGPGLEPGARVRKGELLLGIDDADFRLQQAQRRAERVQAQAALDQELGRAEVAEREWRQLEGEARGGSKLGAALALRRPHIDAARARVAAVESAIARGELDLERCTLVAPFDAVVRERRVAEGQMVTPQTPVAVLVATDRAFVQVSLPLGQLDAIAVPGIAGVAAEDGATARVFAGGAASGASRPGKVVRLLSDLDPLGRMARLWIAVADPLSPPPDAPLAMPLLFGAFVSVELQGRSLDGVVRVPRTALREGDRAFVVGADDRLEVRALQIAYREQDDVLVASGLREGDRLITGVVPGAEPGMRLRPRPTPPSAKSAPAAPAPSDATATGAQP